MSDTYTKHRSLPFLTVAAALGWDVSKFKTRKGGLEFYGPCILHGSKSNQTCFSYHTDGKFRCFSCPAKGSGAIDLVRAARSCNFTDAVAFLEPMAQSPVPSQTPVSAVSLPSQEASQGTPGLVPFTGKYEKFKVDSPWLNARVPDQAIRERYGVFMYNNPARKSAYSGRVMLPFKDAGGTLFGYIARSPEGEPRYLVPTGFPKGKFLFGLHELVNGRKLVDNVSMPFLTGKKLYLVESPFCVLKFASLGIPALSLYGWSMSDEQLALLKDLGRGIVYLPDANKRTEGAVVAAKLAAIGWVKFPELPEGVTDPEALSAEQISKL